MRLRNRRGLDPTFTDVVRQALRDDQVVELEEGEHGLAIAIDGDVLVDGLAWETFDYPLHGGDWSNDQREQIDDLLRRRERYLNDRRNERVETSNHGAAEGVDE